MRTDGATLAAPPVAERRLRRRVRRRRPWLLIGACVLLVMLSATLWAKWRETRERADQLATEMKEVYREAEKLRTESAAAEQRIIQLERQVRGRSAAPRR